ncbi:MAG: hypothetical protein MUE68_09215 [Bacteroidetes bacterium]|jgi:hypothetical protein|nr:hypothetical protein [Bacteroidota bacterium]
MNHRRLFTILLLAMLPRLSLLGQVATPVPPEYRGKIDAERSGMHDAASIRTVFYNFGMVGDYPPDPGNVDLSVFHSAEAPKGTGMNYTDGISPFVLANVQQRGGAPAYIMQTGFRERQQWSPYTQRVMRFEPRPGYFQPDPSINVGRSLAINTDRRTWPDEWYDRISDPDDPGWSGSWNGYFGKQPAADQESFSVMDDNMYDAWDFFPDSRDTTRRGLGLRVEVRGFQWSNPQAANVIFWHYDVVNESTTEYADNIIFGLYLDSGVGGSSLSCDGIYESDDDNAFFDKSLGLNLVYTWDKNGHGVAFNTNCATTGYLGYAYLETPGNAVNAKDDDNDGLLNERRDGGPGQLIIGREAIVQQLASTGDTTKFVAAFGPIELRPAYVAGRWWTGDEDLDWVAELHDAGTDGIFNTDAPDAGEGDGMPTSGEANFDQTDLQESDQIGLTGFKMNRIVAGQGTPDPQVDDIVFFDDGRSWPKRLYQMWTDPIEANRFDAPLVANYNIGFFFASGPFTLGVNKRERFSLALAYGADLEELKRTTKVVQQIYNANYRFAVPPPLPTLVAEAGDGYVRLTWDDVAERGIDPVTGLNDFEGYRIYRSTDPSLLDPKVITNARGTGPLQGSNGRPLAQFDLVNGRFGFSEMAVEGVQYFLGDDKGLRHSWTDTTVVNGQLYYYAVTAYDHGADTLSFYFYPSENPITITQSVRAGIILPPNAAQVRPNPKVLGYVGASTDAVERRSGLGTGSVAVKVLTDAVVPDGHTMRLSFHTDDVDSIRANHYRLVDSTTGKTLISRGSDLAGTGTGQVGSGLQPVVSVPESIWVDQSASGFRLGSGSNAALSFEYQRLAAPLNRRRPGFPADLTITFGATPLDTTILLPPRFPRPVKYRVVAHDTGGDLRLKTVLFDTNNDSTLSAPGEYIDVITYLPEEPTRPKQTWRMRLDTAGQYLRGPMVPPQPGDIYRAVVRRPFGEGDVFAFVTHERRIDPQRATAEFANEPYVVPNPYVGFASFEPERFAVSGRGERRIEFRGLPADCTIRVYTVKGELVKTLTHDGSVDGIVPWNLRSADNLDVAPGLYVFHVDAGALGVKIGKFALIK